MAKVQFPKSLDPQVLAAYFLQVDPSLGMQQDQLASLIGEIESAICTALEGFLASKGLGWLTFVLEAGLASSGLKKTAVYSFVPKVEEAPKA
jgi:hypothetical protein